MQHYNLASKWVPSQVKIMLSLPEVRPSNTPLLLETKSILQIVTNNRRVRLSARPLPLYLCWLLELTLSLRESHSACRLVSKVLASLLQVSLSIKQLPQYHLVVHLQEQATQLRRFFYSSVFSQSLHQSALSLACKLQTATSSLMSPSSEYQEVLSFMSPAVRSLLQSLTKVIINGLRCSSSCSVALSLPVFGSSVSILTEERQKVMRAMMTTDLFENFFISGCLIYLL